MPVTAKLSRAFYDKLGDDVANELVNWFNAVDLSYRTELRELNDLNFARFDARVGERLVKLRAEMEARFAQLEVRIDGLRVANEGRFALIDEQFVAIDARLEERFHQVNDRFGHVNDRFAQVDERLDGMDRRLDKVDDRLDQVNDQLKQLALGISDLKASTIKYLFTFWLGTGVMVIGWFVTRWLVTR